MNSRRWLVRRRWGLTVGIAVTIFSVLTYLAGGFATLSLDLLDFGFRHLGEIQDDPRIAMVDIDDASLRQVGRWPWPRRHLADLIYVLDEAGVGVIALDLVLAEPQPPRLEHPALEPHADIDPPAVVLGEISLADVVDDDRTLAEAIASAGNVYLAMPARLAEPANPPRRGPVTSQPALVEQDMVRASGDVPDGTVEIELSASKRDLLSALAQDFSLNAGALAEHAGVTLAAVEKSLAEVKRIAARYHVTRVLNEHADATFRQVLKAILLDVPPDAESPDRAALREAYRYCTAMCELSDLSRRREARGETAPIAPLGVRGPLRRAYGFVPPLESFVAGAAGVGLVTMRPDVDGVVRRLPALTLDRDHLGFLVARDVLGLTLATSGGGAFDDGCLQFEAAGRFRRWRIPVDDDGYTLINWHSGSSRSDWRGSFEHIPAARVLEVAFNRRAMADNERLRDLMMARAVRWRCGDNRACVEDYITKVRRRDDAQRSSRPVEPGVEEAVDRMEQETLRYLELVRGQIAALEPSSDKERKEFALVHELYRELIEGELVREVEERNAALRQRNAKLLNELRHRLNERICFVGYTASALADTVNSPVYDEMPGVLAHANLTNTILQNCFPRTSSVATDVALIAGVGLMITLVTASRGPRESLIGVVGLIALTLIFAAVVFNVRAYYLAGTAGAVTGGFVVWAFVTLYRQVVEERQRRLVARSLARQTSPAIAAQLTHGATENDFAPQPAVVTCYFSDLQGFTTLSEAIGPERTKDLLNRYLSTMSEVLLRYGGSSKFMGDGVFAYFNAPVWPQDEHAIAACDAALECVNALRALKQLEADGEFSGDFSALVMRTGIHTGTAFAGSYGSGERAEYTCIGDTVNLAARLESVNKLFGTSILVSEQCRDRTGERYQFRLLGNLRVKGRSQPVRVFELLGWRDQVARAEQQYAEAFERAVVAFQDCRWDDARKALALCRSLRRGDLAVEVYEAEIERHVEQAPPSGWAGAIELAAK